MLGINTDGMVQLITIIALAVVATFIGIQKIIKDWKTTDAETSVITLMHAELERMSAQNTALSNELGRLHNEIITLNQQLQKLTIENQRLQTEVCALTEEIGIFKQVSAVHKGHSNATDQT